MDPVNVLISLYKGYGLGDAVQMSAVLQHLRKHLPHWIIDFQAEPGRESVGRGIVHNVFCYGQQPEKHYDIEAQIILYDTFANWHDRPNTRVTSCLHERFGIEWDSECGSYQINVRPETYHKALELLKRCHCTTGRTVAIHYEGDSAKSQKDLSWEQVSRICDFLLAKDYTPLLLDWRGKYPSKRGVQKIPAIDEYGRDAEMNCAIISLCEAFVGIDSGPGKCASATNTPTLIAWTGHHPSPFHDPASNTTHLVPRGYHGLEPVCNDPGVIRFFEANYNVRTYDSDPVQEICAWLTAYLN